ncbi:MGH1-like glycoside hydrolase domain-containing protein [Catellatospora tritici]|uniref:MGH1-like glycoside hydrolase domain-containing protein n=1 Tax=Catellatospora tritici TaxID=2851566 RepID=UPI001C2CE8B5|nr:glucosidase [Catellatospora tritici]MBV1850570.1 glucosidase [Catellatospora tritici]
MTSKCDPGAEKHRLAQADSGAVPWRAWGPYLSERAWGTVREDYSTTGEAWSYFPHDHARSRTYRWNEDGMAGICDDGQRFCFALALWNGQDPILKERMFGLTGSEGNHGEDVKEYWWYEDSTPTHSHMSWRYHYPQAAFPYRELVEVNSRRGRHDPEFELIDTGVFADDRYWSVTADYAKASPTDMCVVVTVANRGPDTATIHVLPTLWFRNTWAWGRAHHDAVPTITGRGGHLTARHEELGTIELVGDGTPTALFCDNETNTERLWHVPGRSAYPKDGINDHVVHGADTVNPAMTGTKAALHYVLEVPAGESRRIRLRLAQPTEDSTDLGAGFTEVMTDRRAEADAFFADLVPPGTTDEEARVVRGAIAGLMWGKQYYRYDVGLWLDGDRTTLTPPEDRLGGRNSAWRHLAAADVISMPDPWEYPWFAAWDLAFHCVAIARVDPTFAKQQLLLLVRDWYMHPTGQLPAYEWAFGDVNPPVHAWAALRVFDLDGGRDFGFLERVMHKLMLNFNWWVNRKDADGDNVFEGGFLGLDNIGPFDRSSPLPVDGRLEQSDGTGWMAMYAANLLEMAARLALRNPSYEDVATKFFEHFAYIASSARSLWNDKDDFYCDMIRIDCGAPIPIRVFSIVGLIPLVATVTWREGTFGQLSELADRVGWFLDHKPEYAAVIGEHRADRSGGRHRLLSMVTMDQLEPIMSRMLDETEFLSPYGLRSISRVHAAEPFVVNLGGQDYSVDYEPAESTIGTFGGNSNWRGPIWMPVNYLLIRALDQFGDFLGDSATFECPTRSGTRRTLNEIADELSERIIAIFLRDRDGRRPLYGGTELFQTHPDWRDRLIYPEYFHGDDGAALGASHQTGWTALVADLILSRPDHQRHVG